MRSWESKGLLKLESYACLLKVSLSPFPTCLALYFLMKFK